MPLLYTRLLHTQRWSDHGLPPSIHWSHKAIHMTSTLCAQQHRQSYTEATHYGVSGSYVCVYTHSPVQGPVLPGVTPMANCMDPHTQYYAYGAGHCKAQVVTRIVHTYIPVHQWQSVDVRAREGIILAMIRWWPWKELCRGPELYSGIRNQ